MDIGDVKYLEAPAKVLKCSAAIRLGDKLIRDARNTLADCAGCALGAAMVAVGICKRDDYSHIDHAFRTLGERFRIPEGILEKASSLHFSGERTRLEVADWLEAQGY